MTGEWRTIGGSPVPPFDLLVISPPDERGDEIDTVHRLFDLGLSRYHLRKPEWGEDEARRFLRSFDIRLRERFVIHAWYSIAEELGVRQVHLTSRARSGGVAIPPRLDASASFHAPEELAAETRELRYGFLGPVFPSISKEGYGPRFPFPEMAAAACGARFPVHAIGGVSGETLLRLRSAGFRGAAVLGAVWSAQDPAAAYRSLREITDTRNG